MLPESLQPSVPRLLIGSEPVIDFQQRLCVEPVPAFPSLPFALDESRLLQNPQMLGDTLTADGQGPRESFNRERAVGSEALEQKAARRVRQGYKDIRHDRRIICNQ